MKKLKLYIPTCDNYLFLIPSFTFLFNKFWNTEQEVVYLGYKKPEFSLPDNFDFISIGVDDDIEYWATDLINFFSSIDDEHFILCVDDQFLVEDTNFESYNKLLKYLDNPKVGRINLCRDTVNRPHNFFDENDGLTVIEAKQDSNFRVSIVMSIWKKEYFLKYLDEGMLPWSFEKEGSERAKNDGYHILGTRGKNGPPDDAPVFTTNAIWRNNLNRFNFHNSNYASLNGGQNYLDVEVVKEMKDKNLINKNTEIGWVFQGIWTPYKEIK